jgi:hypothetical protein
MAEEAEILDPGAWMNMQPIWTWEILFFYASCHLHPTPVGLVDVALPPGSLFSFGRKTDEGSEAEQAIVAAAALIAHMANRVSLACGLGLSEEVAGYWNKYIRPEMAATA